ncbi:Putative protein in type-1 retrotransposable element R1DM [Araneus ventricosus]|uniref:Retrovirus-related Pol polyprotein from type-1 retrotransposable element R1 n=1 Tax=Araneus ventricosus TaxID=182803 RepID=A0A4Y2SXM7_ARAVE|nr:Putative protein in type-1 retrotransposable element R1DM [Araneus ventricosus]
MSKVLDKLVSQRILHHYHSNNLLNPLQHGFRTGKSCETAGFELREVVLERVRRNQGVCMISLDVAGAFDNVSWVSILYQLGEAACPLNIFRLVRSYLRNRSVCYETHVTRVVHEVNRGCPQGSCSGPLFWNIVADSLLNQPFPRNTYVQAYADDLVLVVWGHNESQIAEQGRAAMSIIEEWGELNNLRFNPQKTCMLPITYRRRLSIANPPVVELYGQPIRAVEELKYLGVISDGGFTFHAHFKDRKAAIDTLSYRLTLTVCKWFSKQPRLMKKIYIGALEPKVLYGHSAWGHRLKLKTFYFSWEEYVQMESLYLTHPAIKDGIGFDWKEPKGEGLEIFTDGSGINDKIGAAMVVLYFGQLIHSERVRLGDNCTVYQAELVGLKLAAEFAQTLTITKRVNVFSDSRTALQSWADPINTHPLVGEVKRLLKRARSERGVFLHWVKAHVGYHENELADAGAKAATDSPSVSVELPVSSSRLKCKLRRIIIQAWQDHWDYSPNKDRFTRSIIPKVSLKTHFWGEMAELFTGHGRFPAHLFRFGIGNDERCACGAVGDAFITCQALCHLV